MNFGRTSSTCSLATRPARPFAVSTLRTCQWRALSKLPPRLCRIRPLPRRHRHPLAKRVPRPHLSSLPFKGLLLLPTPAAALRYANHGMIPGDAPSRVPVERHMYATSCFLKQALCVAAVIIIAEDTILQSMGLWLLASDSLRLSSTFLRPWLRTGLVSNSLLAFSPSAWPWKLRV